MTVDDLASPTSKVPTGSCATVYTVSILRPCHIANKISSAAVDSTCVCAPVVCISNNASPDRMQRPHSVRTVRIFYPPCVFLVLPLQFPPHFRGKVHQLGNASGLTTFNIFLILRSHVRVNSL